MRQLLTVRPARESDVKSIHDLLAVYAARQIVLPRTEEDIRSYLGNFVVAESLPGFAGCVAVRDFGHDLLEVRSLVVVPEFQGRGVGKAMLEAVKSGLRINRPKVRLFALTYQVQFFTSLGFKVVERELFPEKIWSDCRDCPKFDCCDETAVLWEYGAREGI